MHSCCYRLIAVFEALSTQLFGVVMPSQWHVGFEPTKTNRTPVGEPGVP